jgi:hypothetical protein
MRVAVACRRVLQVLAGPPFSLRLLLLVVDVEAEDALRLASKFGVTFVGEILGYYPGGHAVRIGYRSHESKTPG